MSFSEDWKYPRDHPISEGDARALLAGELGDQYFQMLAHTCSPLFWHTPEGTGKSPILNNGTLTYVQGREGITFGVTAAHVVNGYMADCADRRCALQLGNAPLELELIAKDDAMDLATLALPATVLREVGKPIAPVSLPRAHDEPQEGRGIMLAGFPGEDKRTYPGLNVDWGLVGIVGVARRVNQQQITWVPEHEQSIPRGNLPELRRNKNLGGMSGGPLIAWFEKAGGLLSYCSLGGVIVMADPALENVVARRAEYIRSDGTLWPFK